MCACALRSRNDLLRAQSLQIDADLEPAIHEAFDVVRLSSIDDVAKQTELTVCDLVRVI